MSDSLEALVTRNRKEWSSSEDGTIGGDVLALCDAAEAEAMHRATQAERRVLELAAHPERGDWEGDGPCQDCGRPSPDWHASFDLWEQVMGSDQAGGVLCPTCFVVRAWKAGIHEGQTWHFAPAAFDMAPVADVFRANAKRREAEAEVERLLLALESNPERGLPPVVIVIDPDLSQFLEDAEDHMRSSVGHTERMVDPYDRASLPPTVEQRNADIDRDRDELLALAAEKHRIARVCNRLPFVTWDRLINHGEMSSIYGWIPRDDGRFDFVVIEFQFAGDREPYWITSSARNSAAIAELLGQGGSHNPCQRVEDVFGSLIERKVVTVPVEDLPNGWPDRTGEGPAS